MKELIIKGKIRLRGDYESKDIEIQEEGKKYLTGLQESIELFFYEKKIPFPYEIILDGKYEITIKKIE